MKLLVVDDHPALRAGLAALLCKVEPGTVVLEACDGAEALRVAKAHPDLAAVFVDLCMPGMDGVSVIQEFARGYAALPLIVISSSEDALDVRRALKLGARGYLPKSASPQTILSAFRLVLSGNVYVPPLLLDAIAAPGLEARSTGITANPRLTVRQLDVLRLLCRGLSNKEISRKLDLSEKTTKSHITSIFKTLNVVNRTQAAKAAAAFGVLPETPGNAAAGTTAST